MEPDSISDRDFAALAKLIYASTGIALADSKKPLVTSRLRKRVRATRLETFGAYYEFARSDDGELQELINAITTNKTEFFREAAQFDDLRRALVPRLSRERRARVWCAAASTGEEPWTIAIALYEALQDPERADVRILATDIDTAVLEKARRAVYPLGQLSGLTNEQRERHFRRTADGWEVRPHLRRWVDFRQLNLIAPSWPHAQRFDAVFCRNVMIYFDHATRDRLVRRFVDYVAPNGRLYVGLSEVLHWLPEVWRSVGPSVYEHTVLPTVSTRPAPVPAPERAPPLLPRRRLIVGQVEACAEPTVLTTLLGSCVAIGLTDPVRGVGGLNHFLLPDAPDVAPERAASYGAYAIELLINEVLKAGGVRRNLEAKIFGGGRVLSELSAHEHIGEQNLAFAREFLARDGIRVVTERSGGEGGLDVAYFTATGKSFVRPIPIAQLEAAAHQERTHRQALSSQPAASGDVELF